MMFSTEGRVHGNLPQVHGVLRAGIRHVMRVLLFVEVTIQVKEEDYGGNSTEPQLRSLKSGLPSPT
jgi:hypothetical protein